MIWATIAVGVFLILLSGTLMYRNAAARQQALAHPLSDDEIDFLNRQHRRRLQTNLMLGIVGIAIIASNWVTGTTTLAVYWLIVLLITVWIALLGIADYMNTRAFFHIIEANQVEEHADLMREIHQLTQNKAGEKTNDND